MQAAEVNHVLIVGGGTAGWLAACRIAAAHSASSPQPLKVTLVESPDVPIIGVGEGTWPTLRETLEAIGVKETDFIRKCNATFKQGGKFVGWATGAEGEAYYHPFNLPRGHGSFDLTPYWDRLRRDTPVAFADAVDYQAAICELGLAPKTITTREYQIMANYAYHLDAPTLGLFLRDHGRTHLGIEHVVDHVKRVVLDADGYISHLETQGNGALAADLFVDCTGFKSLLLGEALGVPLKSYENILFVDTALAAQVPYNSPDQPIATHTIATAQDAGWIWDIGLQTRRGTGHVYSSAHTSHEEAERALRRYIAQQDPDKAESLETRRIPLVNGHREIFWKKNCVAIGLAAGFLEPLEASAIMLIETSVKMIAERIPKNRTLMEPVAAQFNAVTQDRWNRIIDFLKLHYAITRRTDTEFWRDNQRSDTIPDSLLEKLAIWRHHPPGAQDFLLTGDVFPAASYLYVLLGMGHETDYHTQAHSADMAKAGLYFNRNQAALSRAKTELPKHRDLIDAVLEYGMKAI